MHRIARILIISSTCSALALAVHAAPRSPQVPVAGSALATFFASQGQTINVNTDQSDAQRQGVPATTNFQVQTFSTNGTQGSVGIYNAALASPALNQILPGASVAGWFAVAGFRLGPTRLVVNLFDAASALQGTTTYLGADPTDFSFYVAGPGGTQYQQDLRNAAGLPRLLLFAGTGPRAGSTWIACETSPTGAGDFADVIALVNLAIAPVSNANSSWSRVKSLFR